MGKPSGNPTEPLLLRTGRTGSLLLRRNTAREMEVAKRQQRITRFACGAKIQILLTDGGESNSLMNVADHGQQQPRPTSLLELWITTGELEMMAASGRLGWSPHACLPTIINLD